jgi:hypothetical protein
VIGEIFTPIRTWVGKSEARFLKLTGGIQGRIIINEEEEFDKQHVVNTDPSLLSNGRRYPTSSQPQPQPRSGDGVSAGVLNVLVERGMSQVVAENEVLRHEIEVLQAKVSDLEREKVSLLQVVAGLTSTVEELRSELDDLEPLVKEEGTDDFYSSI